MFENDPTITVMLSTYLKGKPPPTWEQTDWRRFHASFRPVECTPRKLAEYIYTGYAFTPVFNGRRREENFTAAHHLAFDMDTQGIDYIMRAGTFCDYFASFAYSTPSSTPEAPRGRVVFIFQHPITSPDIMREIYSAVDWWLRQDGLEPDRQCKDPLRLYFGSPHCDVIPNWSLLTDDVIAHVVAEYYKTHTPAQTPQPTPPPTYQAHDDYIEYRMSRTLDKLRSAGDGERHRLRRDIGRAFGGYVAAGYLSQQEAINRLINAAPTDTPKKAADELTAAVFYGMREPLYIHGEPGLDEVLNV